MSICGYLWIRRLLSQRPGGVWVLVLHEVGAGYCSFVVQTNPLKELASLLVITHLNRNRTALTARHKYESPLTALHPCET